MPRQEALGLAKDGKTFLGLVLTRILARHGKGTPGGKGGGGSHRHSKPFAAVGDKSSCFEVGTDRVFALPCLCARGA